MTAAVEMSAAAQSQHRSEERALDGALEVLRDNARSFARLPIREKIGLLRSSMDLLADAADAWTADGARARGITDYPGEEMVVGPVPTMRNLRLLAESLERLEAGRPLVADGQVSTRSDGRVEVRTFPTDAIDGALFSGITLHQLMLPGVAAAEVKAKAGAFYQAQDPEGGVSLILGAGNVSSIPPMDMLYKSFAEGFVCLVKVNPVNEWVGPHMERAFRPFVERGFLRVVYGGAEVGSYLVNHAMVDDIHITGSNHTHDLIVWGPPGPERERRKAANDPVLKKRITSELGNVSPVAVVPADYSDAELDFMARNAAAMVTNNASFNCNAAKMLITSKGWSQRQRFLDLVARTMGEMPTRLAYYPGAKDRYQRLTAGRSGVQRIGEGSETKLPWTLIPDVDASRSDEPLFSTEPFCSILSETSLEAKDPAQFLAEATRFMNDRLWGTLNAMIVIHPKLEESGEVKAALDRAILELRYGTVGINHWPALAYATTSPAWGGHPSATLQDVQSGIGWVHNTYLLEGIEKTILRGPLKLFPKPVWFGGHKRVEAVARRLLAMERDPSWLKVPGIALNALQG